MRVRVAGEFPRQDPNAVMSSEDLWACQGVSRLDAARMCDFSEKRVIAIDFARFGSDESCIVRRQGHAILDVTTYARREPTFVVEQAFAMQRKARWGDRDTMYVVDAGGMGQGVLGRFHECDKNVFEFHNAGKSSKTDYANKITEAYFKVRELVRARRLHLPEDKPFTGKPGEVVSIVMEKAIEQLSSRLYLTDNKGKLILESKDQYVERMMESPDRADAIAMACYDGVTVGARGSGR